MKIGIIGGGFYGCYIAQKLSLKHKVTIIDKNASILMEAAKYNQYRLHQGYHYPRSEETIKQTFLGYKKKTVLLPLGFDQDIFNKKKKKNK